MLCAFSCALVVFLCAAFIISSFISLAVIVPVVLLCALRFYFILPNRSRTRVKQRDSSSKCSLAVFLGSGGHTSEALTLLESLDFTRYTPRTYIVCEGDESSADKARRLEDTKTSSYLFSDDHEAPYKILRIPRAREVHQPILEAPITALRSLGLCIWHVTIDTLRSGRSFSDVLIMNGPGTCFILCLAFYINKFLGRPAPRLIYVESVARVHSPSLSGKLLRPFVDRFVVQWPDLVRDSRRDEYLGLLV